MLEYLANINVTVLGYLALACTALLAILLKRRQGNTPPGVSSYSLFGDGLEIKRHGIREVCKKHRQMYGDTFKIRIMADEFIVCCGYEQVSEMLVQNRHFVMERINRPLRDAIFGKRGVITTTGDTWKRTRSFTLQTLKEFGMGKRMLETKMFEEIEFFLDALDKTKGEPFDIAELLHRSVSNVMGSIVFGERYDYNDEEFNSYLKDMKNMVEFSVFFKYPWQKYIPGDPFAVKAQLETLGNLRDFYVKRIDKHFIDFKKDSKKDFIDVYINEMQNNNSKEKDSFFNDQELFTLVHDMYSAGTETTAVTLRWALVFLMRDYAIQTSIQEEIDANIPHSRFPTTTDKTKLPYFYATVQEVLRRACIVPIVGRILSEEIQLDGYTLPKSSNVLFDLESILMDNKLWKDPEKFDPSRFIGGKEETKLDKVLTFGTGPRSCLGEALARMEVFVYLAAMLQHYRFLPPLGEGPPGLDSTYGVTHAPNRFYVRAIRRRDTVK